MIKCFMENGFWFVKVNNVVQLKTKSFYSAFEFMQKIKAV